MLALEGLVKHYTSGREEIRAVDGVNLHLDPGEMVAVHGPSGSGKTTLLLMVAALLAPDRGTVRYEGRDVSAFSEREACEYLMRDVGFVYQRFRLMGRVSAVENASRKLWLGGVELREAQRRAVMWLGRVGLGDRLGHPPEQLSGGERQRVAIARTLAAEPRLILADEPTAYLDSTRSQQIVALLRQVAHERDAAVLLVTHDLEIAATADRRLTLRDGKLTEDTASQSIAITTPIAPPRASPPSASSRVRSVRG